MATTGGRDEMRTPVENDVPLGRVAVETLERSERMRPAVMTVLLLGAISIMVPGAPQWIGVFVATTGLLLDRRFRTAAYRFVGTPNAERRDAAEFWDLTSMAYLLLTLPVLALLLTYQLAGSVAGIAAL